MAQGRRVRLPDLREVPAAWPLQTVLDAWVHLNANWNLSDIQTANAALEQRLELWASQPEAAARCLELKPSEAPREAKLAEALSRYGRAERQRCYVVYFTAQGLVREVVRGVVWTHFDDRCRELAGRLIAAEAKAGEAKRRRLEEGASSASRELQAAKEEIARHQQREEELTVRVAELEASALEKSIDLEAVHEERARLADHLERAAADVQVAQDEAAKHKEQLQQVEARVHALEAEKAAQLQASDEECRQLAERLAAAEALVSVKAAELDTAQVETSKQAVQIEQLMQQTSEAQRVAAESQEELRKAQAEDEARKRADLHSFLIDKIQALSEDLDRCSGKRADLQSLLIENTVYKNQCAKAEADASAKMDEIKALSEEKGKYKERCSQLQQQLAEAKEQARRLSGGFATTIHPTFPHHGPAVGKDPGSPESHTSEELGYVLVEDDTASVLSSSSWFSVKPHCFMRDSVFKTRSYGIDFFMMGKDLKAGSQVVAGNDQDLLTVAKAPEVCTAAEVIILQAGNATLQVTPDHLVQVPVNKKGPCAAGSVQYTQAGTLKPGDLVILDSGEPMALTSVESKHLDCEVLKLVFEPDLPIAVFSCPPCIVSKCQRKPSIRRGGMSQRGQGVPDTTGDGRVSIPITAGEYMD